MEDVGDVKDVGDVNDVCYVDKVKSEAGSSSLGETLRTSLGLQRPQYCKCFWKNGFHKVFVL